MEINLSDLKNKKDIKFNIEMNHQIFNDSKTAMIELVQDKYIKKVYKELSPSEITQIFLGDSKFQSIISSSDILDAICDMNGTDFNDAEMTKLDSNNHHGKKAKGYIQKEKELAIKDLEGLQPSGPTGPDR